MGDFNRLPPRGAEAIGHVWLRAEADSVDPNTFEYRYDISTADGTGGGRNVVGDLDTVLTTGEYNQLKNILSRIWQKAQGELLPL